MKTRITALLIMLAAMVLLSACSAGTHSDTGVSSKPDTTSSFSESKESESSSQPESTSASLEVEKADEVRSDVEESGTSIQASAASESVNSSSAQAQTQTKPSSAAQPQAETSPEQKPQSTQEPTPEPVKPQPTEKPTPKPTEEPTPEPTQQPAFDIGHWVSYAQGYAQSKGLNLDGSATECWDNPISAGANCTSTESNIISRINRYAKDEDITDVWIWAESTGNGNYDLYIGYA